MNFLKNVTPVKFTKQIVKIKSEIFEVKINNVLEITKYVFQIM